MATVVRASAGVYLEVEDRSQITTTQKQVSVGAIVLLSKKGPVDQIVRITNGPNQFNSIFGDTGAENCFGHGTARTALLYMQELLVTRVHNDARYGGLIVKLKTLTGKIVMNKFTSKKAVDPTDPNKFYMAPSDGDFDDVNDMFYVYGVDPNDENGNYRVSIANVKDKADKNNPNTFQLLVYSKNSTTGARPLETWTVSRSQQTDGYGRQQYLEKVINGRSRYIRVINNPFNTLDVSTGIMPTELLNTLDSTGNPLAYLSDGDSGILDAGTLIPVEKLQRIYNGNTDPFSSVIVDAPVQYKNSGWQLYSDREEINFDLLLDGGICLPSVQRTMLAIADNRGDCFAVLDMPFDSIGDKYDPTTAPILYRDTTAGGLGSDTPNGALYSDWYRVLDQVTGQTINIPPSGHVAAVYCATDINFATWFAPAGLNRGLLTAIDPNFIGSCMIYHQTARDALEAAQVNFTRTIQNIGTALWSAVTLQRIESAESNVSVVRLIKFLARNISIKLLYSVFDPNDPYLRAQIVHSLTDILEPIKLNRGLYSYSVVCTGPGEPNSNNTWDDIALGNLNVDVYLEPEIPAKRINVKLIVNKAGVSIGSATTLG